MGIQRPGAGETSNILLNAATASDVIKEVTDTSSFIDMLLMEYTHKIRNGVYGFTSKVMAYNSNRIEGGKLSEEQAHNLFETRSVYGDEEYRAHDIEEMEGHFLMFNYMLDTIEDRLSINMIKEFHKRLKQCVLADILSGYVIGDWKTIPNMVRGQHTTEPNHVSEAMNGLLEWYASKEKTINTMILFHASYEAIHPFQDGNGRTGRVILFRECIKHGISPFIIRDGNKSVYIQALKYAQQDDCSIF